MEGREGRAVRTPLVAWLCVQRILINLRFLCPDGSSTTARISTRNGGSTGICSRKMRRGRTSVGGGTYAAQPRSQRGPTDDNPHRTMQRAVFCYAVVARDRYAHFPIEFLVPNKDSENWETGWFAFGRAARRWWPHHSHAIHLSIHVLMLRYAYRRRLSDFESSKHAHLSLWCWQFIPAYDPHHTGITDPRSTCVAST